MSLDGHAKWIELSDGASTISLSFYEALGYSQSYENIGGHSTIRTLNGTGLKQRNWGKLRTSVSGNGGVPLSMSGLDFSDALVLKCGAPRHIRSASNVIVIPAERRTLAPYLPYGYKVVFGYTVPAAISMVGNTATITTDADATAYGVAYFPEIEILMNNPSEGFDVIGNDSSWSFTAEQR